MIASELRARRRRLGLTQAELAEKLGVTANTVARWERGELAIARPRMLRVMLEHLEAERDTSDEARRAHNERMRGEMQAHLANEQGRE